MTNLNQPRLVLSSILTEPAVAPLMHKLCSERPEVFKHSLNVAYLVSEICCTSIRDDMNFKMNLTDEDVIEMITGALLHDIGKLNIPSDILNKPDKLTKEEVDIIMNHPLLGYEMLVKQGGFSEIVLDIVKHHHEKLDGFGYPDHIKDIPPTTQCVAFCDMYDALTETRPYRSKKSMFLAYKTICDENLDPDLFLLLASCFDR